MDEADDATRTSRVRRVAHVGAFLDQADSASDDLKFDGSSPSVFSLR